MSRAMGFAFGFALACAFFPTLSCLTFGDKWIGVSLILALFTGLIFAAVVQEEGGSKRKRRQAERDAEIERYIITDQAEAYANAMRREVLEAVISLLESRFFKDQKQIENAIRAMTPKETT